MVPEIWGTTQNFLSFWTVFCLFTLSMDPANQNFEKMKKCLGILSLWTCVPYRKIILCMVSEIWSVMDKFFCHFRLFFCPFTPLTT